MKKCMLILMRFYKSVISHYLKSQCKFYPTCSVYASSAIEKYGLFKGSVKTVFRLIKCNPLSNGGIDFP